MDKNFKTRLIVGICLFVVAIVGLYTFNSVPFKVAYTLFGLMAGVEVLSFLQRKHDFKRFLLAIVELGFLYCGTLFVLRIDAAHFWYIILGVPGYDVFAYLFGKRFGGKIFGKSRPFPRISKNKTWEGTLFGLLIATSLVALLMAFRFSFSTDWMFLLCGPLALCGDLFESYLKRQFGVKDSNEVVIKNPVFKKIEVLVGGTGGHGGYLDRIDSTALTASVLLVIECFI